MADEDGNIHAYSFTVTCTWHEMIETGDQGWSFFIQKN